MMSLRDCRGGSRGPVRIKVAKVISKQGKLKSEDLDVYEDNMVCATDGRMMISPGKRRGRPKKNLPESRRPEFTIQNSRQVVYIPSPSSNRQTYSVLPMKNQVTVSNSQGVSQQVSIVNPNIRTCNVGKQKMPNPVTQYIPPQGLRNRPPLIPHIHAQMVNTSLSLLQKQYKSFELSSTVHSSEEVDNYPEDLKQLEKEYDDLAGSKVWEIISWMDPTKENLKLPRVVQTNHELVNELFPTPDLESKVDEVVDWLQEHFPTSQDKPKIVPPKVVVETQPSHLEGCNQWSSMADNQIGQP